jgi:hypothetical protein
MSLNTTIPIPNQESTQNCTAISALCPVDQTIYGYYPSLPVNAFFCGAFGILLAIQLVQGLKFKTWTFMIAMGFGCLGEAIGYVGRIILHNNPWSGTGFDTQICCLIIAPAFLSAAIYLTLKHLVLALSPDLSPIPARFYTYIFIACDFLSLVLQGAGGGIAATANPGSNGQNIGNDLMLTGICWQVVTLFTFACLTGFYLTRVWQNRTSLSSASAGYRNGGRFKLFCGAILLAFLTIFVRCLYRYVFPFPPYPIYQRLTYQKYPRNVRRLAQLPHAEPNRLHRARRLHGPCRFHRTHYLPSRLLLPADGAWIDGSRC